MWQTAGRASPRMHSAVQTRAIAHRQAVAAYVGPGSGAESEPSAGDEAHTSARDNFTSPEVTLGKRCHGAHLETLKLDITPVASHYQLIHYDVPCDLDAATHKLRVFGLVGAPAELSMAQLRALPHVSVPVVLECAGQGRVLMTRRLWQHVPWGVDAFGCARWTGCSLADVLRAAAPTAAARQVVFTGADLGVQEDKVQHFERALSLEDALELDAILAYEMNGAELTRAHGYPLRLIVPGWYGMASVKWLTSIELTDGSWTGLQMEAYAYARRAHDATLVPVQYLNVRALMVPPGAPDFFTRTRVVKPGTCRVEGKAWGGVFRVVKVEFSTDGSATWRPAVLNAEPNGPHGCARRCASAAAQARRETLVRCTARGRPVR